MNTAVEMRTPIFLDPEPVLGVLARLSRESAQRPFQTGYWV